MIKILFRNSSITLEEYVGRPNPLYYAEELTKKIGGSKIYLKSDHLNHLGAHKINNALFQVLLAKRMGKTKIKCETGAGAHLIAVAACCAKFNIPCEGYMGIDDIFKQSTNVLKAKLFNSKVIECADGSGKKGVLKDACTAVLKAWSNDPSSYYACGSTIGPYPFPQNRAIRSVGDWKRNKKTNFRKRKQTSRYDYCVYWWWK